MPDRTGAEASEFDGNGYRKRVLAAVERRGGPAASDPFELYDLPPDDDLADRRVAERVEAVWAFWQRQRDHPKYRVLVGELVAGHGERSAELLDVGRRRTAAARVRAEREQRDAQRYALLDAAITRLVDRHGAVPGAKVAGLHEVGVLAGLSPDEVTTRLRRHRIAAAPTTADHPGVPSIGPDRRRQLRMLLEEFGRLAEVPAPPTLLALLELPPTAADEQIRARAGAWRSRAAELAPGRMRAVLDELLVHVAELLEPGRAAVEAYLTAVAADVAEQLRPRVRAAVLVEDRLVAEDHAYLLDEAVGWGLDRGRAAAVLAAVAAELGAPIDGAAGVSRSGPRSGAAPPSGQAQAAEPGRGERVRPPDRRWADLVRAARAELRAGRPVAAERLVAEAQALAGADGRTQSGALADEVAAELAAAERHRRTAVAECAAGRFAAALPHLEHLQRAASDVPAAAELAELLGRARVAVQRADAAVAAALAGPEPDRAAGLRAVLDDCPDHPGAVAALARISGPAPPSAVSAVRIGAGSVAVSWHGSVGAEYRVRCLGADGRWRVVGRTRATAIEDGGAPAGPVEVYAVSAAVDGARSVEVRSDG